MSYTITLTEQDVGTIAFVGFRYGWSDALRGLEAGDNILAEHEAWNIRDAIESDTEGGHSYFPMLDGRCELADKLYAFLESIV